MGILGLLGFLGFLGYSMKEPTFYCFFGFFGFFAWYWWGKLEMEGTDERLVQNQLKATNKAMSLSFAVVYVGMILTGNLIGDNPIAAYSILVILIAMGFAMALNLTAYLTYKYDRED